MNQFDGANEEGLSIEKILRQLLKEHFSTGNDELRENNNSFIFLEKSSLNLLLAYLLLNSNKETPPSVNEELAAMTSEKIDQMIQANEKDFKAIIHSLK